MYKLNESHMAYVQLIQTFPNCEKNTISYNTDNYLYLCVNRDNYSVTFCIDKSDYSISAFYMNSYYPDISLLLILHDTIDMLYQLFGENK